MVSEAGNRGPNAQVLLFELNGQVYGLDVQWVREVLGYRPFTPLPSQENGCAGVIHVRGKVIPVVDVRAKLGMPPAEPGPFRVYVLLERKGKNLAVLVDSVLDVVEAGIGQGGLDLPSGGGAVRSLVEIDGRTVALLSPEELCPSEMTAAAVRE